MTPSLPCANCGQVDDLEMVTPLGTLGYTIVWNCRCGNTRAVKISHDIPLDLIRKAIEANEMADISDQGE